MKSKGYATSIALLAAFLCLPGAAKARPAACDRACLSTTADQVLASMVAHDSASLPLARSYKATENAVPAALSMMTLWKTPTAVRHKYYVIDPKSGQVFLVADMAEGSGDVLVFGRIKMADRQIEDVELYSSRSRGDVGFQFDAQALGTPPDAWTVQLGPQRRASRETLLTAGRSIFDTSVNGPPPSADCVLMENGKVVEENPDVLKQVMPKDGHPQPELKRNSDGLVSIPCGLPPNRPTDPHARTDIVDEDQGVVVSIATVQGVVAPYLVTSPTESAFVPDAMYKPYAEMLVKQRSTGHYALPAMQGMRASITVAEMHRVYDGKLQGMEMLQRLGPPDARSPWVNVPDHANAEGQPGS